MTLDDIRARVAEIARIQDDYEAAHAGEDMLYADFIRHVAEHGPADLAEMAAAVLETEKLDFARYCA